MLSFAFVLRIHIDIELGSQVVSSSQRARQVRDLACKAAIFTNQFSTAGDKRIPWPSAAEQAANQWKEVKEQLIHSSLRHDWNDLLNGECEMPFNCCDLGLSR